ncbi:MAG: glycosyltransferase, partial [Bryobacteraceae bacterium]|nr:glycosyltransferase [Bryobacteraceae bacterium]
LVIDRLRKFRPDLIHITGPGDMGILGFWASNILKIPMAASWHTNLHEYASKRLQKAFRFAPCLVRNYIGETAESQSLRALMGFYRLAHFTLAPNQGMVNLLDERTGRPAYLMQHGVDADRFCPQRRERQEGTFCIGYVGRLTPEKNVRSFVELERNLLAAGQHDFRFLLVGEGSERDWLARNLKNAELPGTLTGGRLAAAFAGMDAFVFPSGTDTFGLVVLEAMASGVPVVVTPCTGARVEIEQGVSGFLAEDFTGSLLELMRGEALRRRMGAAARRFACSRMWSSVFENIYETYDQAFLRDEVRRRMTPPLPCLPR